MKVFSLESFIVYVIIIIRYIYIIIVAHLFTSITVVATAVDFSHFQLASKVDF